MSPFPITFMPSAELFVCRGYSSKTKRRKIEGEDDDDDTELEESVRKITALLTQNDTDGNGISSDPGFSEEGPQLDARVTSISAEIAAAIVHAHTSIYEEEEDDDSGEELGIPETTGPNTSGIRGDGVRLLDAEDEDDDSDAFPIPLRTRKGKEALGLVGTKRKR